MTDPQFATIDSNILLRHFLQDHDEHSPRASALLLEVRKGTKRVFCPPTVVFEVIYVLLGRTDLDRPSIALALNNLITLPGFVIPDQPVAEAALDFWAKKSPLSYADCYHLALTEAQGLTQIYTFDKKMDRYPGVERIEP